jgi:tRNA modification GTPase
MNLLNADEGPIIACSTGLSSNTAISVIRISGIKSLEEIQKFLSINVGSIEPRYAHYCSIAFDGAIIDDIVLIYLKAPNSYNGENIIELNVHGNQVNVKRIINLFINNSEIRHSLAGEFSYRALKNGKLSVSEIEGLELLLNASNSFALDQGQSLLNGDLKKSYIDLYDSFVSHKGAIELSIDFLEDIGEEKSNEQVDSTLVLVKSSIDSLYKKTQISTNGLLNPKIVIAGIPNSGKSTLFNSFLGKSRAIVSDIQGTTRDYISEKIFIEDSVYELIDTAGIRESSEEIEKQGIKAALDQIEDAFYKILLINPFLSSEFYKDLDFSEFDNILFSHNDIDGFDSAVSEFCSKYTVGKADDINAGSIGPDDISSIYDDISCKFSKLVKGEPVLLERHVNVISSIYNKIEKYSKIVTTENDIAIISSELNIIGQEIQELIGIVSPDDVLHNVFDNFCIGK